MIIQFLHSEKEHKPDRASNYTHIDWNYGAHFRKFIQANGKYIKDYKLNTEQITAKQMLWCEWEPQSYAKKINKLSRDYPQYLYEPYFDLSAPLSKLIRKRNGDEYFVNRQNTDPFIFGDNFKYFVCRQGRTTGYSRLTNLQPGDVILYGSHRREWINEEKTQKRMWFILDTVFVVSDIPAQIIYTPQNFVHNIKGNVSDEYYNISFISAFSSELHSQIATPVSNGFKLYYGATYSKPYNGMFSFVPSLPIEEDTTAGFERPKIAIPNVINGGLNTNFRISAEDNEIRTKLYWEETAKQVLNQGLFLGINFEMPKNKTPKSYKLENEEIIKGEDNCFPDL